MELRFFVWCFCEIGFSMEEMMSIRLCAAGNFFKTKMRVVDYKVIFIRRVLIVLGPRSTSPFCAARYVYEAHFRT
ncbi:hypothetical protein HanIR_Chr15g0764121 [Helianthus annuus]|nr:hypothetical protein HanIR_Chr15g0764121 [Helianthus annuus]